MRTSTDAADQGTGRRAGPARAGTDDRSAGPARRPGDAAPARSLDPRPLLHRPLTSYYLIMGSAALLLTLGLVMVLSASSVTAFTTTGDSFYYFDRQLTWLLAGLPLMLLATRLPIRVFRWAGYPLLLTSLALMLLLAAVPSLGVTVNGATRWIALGPLQLQPSEPAKLALVLWGADLLARKETLLDQWRHLLVPLLPVTTLCVLLVMAGSDLGTTVVFLVITLALLWVAGAPVRLFGLLFAAGVTAAAGLVMVEPYRLQRVTTFLDPQSSPAGAAWQPIQGLYALGSGSWFGLGLGASRQKWGLVPNQYTDYIFSIIGEELGLLGTLVVVGLFLTLGYAGIRTARRNTDAFSRLTAATVTAWLLGQALINMGAVVGLLPITGIPLPMVSFGGSALVPTMVAVGVLGAIARREPAAAVALAARRRERAGRRRWRIRLGGIRPDGGRRDGRSRNGARRDDPGTGRRVGRGSGRARLRGHRRRGTAGAAFVPQRRTVRGGIVGDGGTGAPAGTAGDRGGRASRRSGRPVRRPGR